MDDALNGCQPDAGAFKRLRRVETLEYAEQFTDIFHIKADSIVSNEQHDLMLFLVQASYFNSACERVLVNFTAFEIRLSSTSRSIERSP
jgi:hypothetical protein